MAGSRPRRCSQLSYPPLEGEGALGDAQHRPVRAGWGDSLSPRTAPKLRGRHPTPSRIPLRFMRADPPPPGEGKRSTYTDAVVPPPSTTMVWPVTKLDASEPR